MSGQPANELPESELADALAAIGRSESHAMVLDTESLRRFSLAIGGDGDVSESRPVLAHWAWFLPMPTDGQIGHDGHPRRGGFLPALPSLPRRMFASTKMRFSGELALEREAHMTTTVASVSHKAGSSGDLVFVEVDRNLEQDGETRVAERQTFVYRAPADGAPMPLPECRDDALKAPHGGDVFTPGTPNLFRFSAVTFNGHRIHYDLPYATGEEGYPSLVVQGLLIASRLAELARQRGALATFAFRAQAPCFVDQPIRLAPAGEGEFHAIRCDGTLATSAKAGYE